MTWQPIETAPKDGTWIVSGYQCYTTCDESGEKKIYNQARSVVYWDGEKWLLVTDTNYHCALVTMWHDLPKKGPLPDLPPLPN